MWARLLGWVHSVGADPDESVDRRTQRQVLVLVSLIVATLAIAWGAVYLAFDEPVAAIIPWTYTFGVLLSMAVFARTKGYPGFRFNQILLILLLPFLLQIALGGFVNASAVIIWSLLAPLGALVMTGRKRALAWFVAYAVLVVCAQLIQPSLAIDNNLPDTVIAGFFVANIVAATGVCFFALNYSVGLLDAERAKSDRLLLNVLPKEIAETLKEGDRTIAKRYPEVTVLFADVVGFTPLSSELEADEIVRLLNDVFSYFDSLVARYGLEKIRTMGDSYMVASGVPTPRDDHALALTDMALAMFDYQPSNGGRESGPLQFRAGLSSGPAVAGVIGTAKFQYDVWGDTVNTASRMETLGVPGRIQISPSAFALLKDDFVCEPRGVLDVKGLGSMETWFVNGRR